MTTIDDPLVREVGRVSSALMVSLTAKGVRIPIFDEQPPITLDLPRIALLQELSGESSMPLQATVDAVCERTGGDRSTLVDLLRELQSRGLLVEPFAGTSTPTPVATAGAAMSPVGGSEKLKLHLPVVLRITPDGFEHLDHDGRALLRLDAAELAFAAEFCQERTRDEALEHHATSAGANAIDNATADDVITGLTVSGLLHRIDPDRPDAGGVGRDDGRFQVQMARLVELNRRCQEDRSAHEAAEAERRVRTGVTRTRVVPVLGVGNSMPPLALGMVLAYAAAHDGGRLQERYDLCSPGWYTFHAGWSTSPTMQVFAEEPAIFLYSNYIWCTTGNLKYSAEAKRSNPNCINVHGGPDTPKYPDDVRRFFATHPHVDVAVHGEGEVTAAEMLAALAAHRDAGEPFDLSVLADVPGLSFRHGDSVHHTADRDRITDLDTIPSPYLTGLCDAFGHAGVGTVVLETNRGCPYGCTFCDWGSATLSRVRKFDLDRVFAELEWCAVHHIEHVGLADANFGIFERDVLIAEKVAELKSIHGYPKSFGTNYAKNTVKHLQRIVEVLVEAGILTEGLLSLQSMDEGTLSTVNRSNIKVEKYDALAREFRRANLPLFVDLMLGLPGSTIASFHSDLQQCIDREVTGKVFPTELLINSPMNDPAYREKHKIETGTIGRGFATTKRVEDGTTHRRLVVATSTYSTDDFAQMLAMRRTFLVCENFGLLRQISRFVRQETGSNEIEYFERLRQDANTDSDRWPTIAFTMRAVPHLMVAPVSWKLLIDELRLHATEVLGLADDSALDTVLSVQHSLMPSRERRFPVTIDLAHDYAAWHAAMIEAKDAGHLRDWPSVVPRLGTYPPASFTVDDPHHVCTLGLGFRVEGEPYGDWELDSPVARSMPSMHLVTL